MLTAAETARMNRIKQAALRGDAKLVSREDKQWCLDIAAREKVVQHPATLAKAAMEGFDVQANIMCM
jgi:hypothetical protein